jgi:hypothetical protein
MVKAAHRKMAQTPTLPTVTIGPGTVMAVHRTKGTIRYIRASRPATDGIGYRIRHLTRITVNRYPNIGISPTTRSTLQRSTVTSPS